MSYASVAAKNAPPESQQPHPDPNLLEGRQPHDDVNQGAPDVNSSKVNVVPAGTDLEHIKTESAEAYEEAQIKIKQQALAINEEKEKAEKKVKDSIHSAEEKFEQGLDQAEEFAKGASAKLDKATKDGRERLEKGVDELRKKGKEEGKKIRKAAREAEKNIESYWKTFSSDPKYWGPALGAINAALLGGLGLFAYIHKEQVKTWDKRLISAVSVGVLGLLGGQG
ncbi:hypothetical protein IE53DRAFT_319775 [Violaceomyces palustris]|uniref:Uncharacterized protein n=1 Tax=Violaceomyces palustris TaxID=1673888 RepID=A0ACD0NR68_9BASI|nr:hypothetical protein IE53DRAFT_319775 [Violaceomyces palustris]